MQTRTMMMIWLVALLLVGGALLGACSGATSSPAPAATAGAPVQPPATAAVEAATTAPTSVPNPTAPATVEPVPATEAPPAIDAAALLEARCTDCHSLNKVTAARYTQEQWQQVVTRMVQKGASLTADEQAILVAYLAETYKP